MVPSSDHGAWTLLIYVPLLTLLLLRDTEDLLRAVLHPACVQQLLPASALGS